MGQRRAAPGERHPGLLGGARLPQRRRPLARGALLLAGRALILAGTAGGLHDLSAGAVRLEGHDVVALAGDGQNIWALADGRALWRSSGEVWEEVASIPDHAARCVGATPAGVLVGTAEAHLLRVPAGRPEPVEAFDRVEGREGWYTPWGGPPDTRSLSAGPDGVIYVNVHVGGIPRSRDGGATWEPTIDVDADVHQVLAHPSEAGVVLAATAFGMSTSLDGGETWSSATEGLHAAYCRAVAVTGDHVVVSASTGPFTERAAVYRRPLHGEGPFERCEAGLPGWFGANIDTHCLAAGGDLVALGTDDGDVFISEDGGRRWERAAGGLPAVGCVLVAA